MMRLEKTIKWITLLVLGSALVRPVTAAETAWLTDLSKAQAQAKHEKKWVSMDFNGSDRCPPCKALRKNVLTSPEFIQYAKTNLVLVDVDFPKFTPQSEEQKKANERLCEQYKVEGFPTIVVLNSDGKELTKRSGYYVSSPKDFLADLEKLRKQQ